MRRFRFALQRLLQYRMTLEEQAIQAFGQAQLHLRLEQERLNELKAIRGSLLANSSRTRRLSVPLLQVEQTYLQRLEECIEGQQQRVRIAEEELEARRRELVEAQRQRKVLERLREKHYETWKLENLREEQKLIDEIAVMRSAHPVSEMPLRHRGGTDE